MRFTTKTIEGSSKEERKGKTVTAIDEQPKREEEIIVRKMSDQRLCFFCVFHIDSRSFSTSQDDQSRIGLIRGARNQKWIYGRY